jgi:phosphoribosylformylglycinamidine cyclo-ligase
MPGMYVAGEYDLAGFCVGVVEKSKIIDGSTVTAGDVILGLGASGLHSNGYSLARRIVEVSGADLDADFHGRPLADALLAPTRIYVKPVLALMAALPVKALAHITGGGLPGNLPRVLPESMVADIDGASWPRPPLFGWLQSAGGVADEEMYRTFNCGLGMVLVVAEADAGRAIEQLTAAGETVSRIGTVRARRGDEPQTAIR